MLRNIKVLIKIYIFVLFKYQFVDMVQRVLQLHTVIQHSHYHALQINVLVTHINIGVEVHVLVKKQMAQLAHMIGNVIKV